MEMGKHDKGTPINESLERHYQERIAELEAKLEAVNAENKRLDMELERKDIQLGVAQGKAETFSKALAEMTAKYVMIGGEM